MVFSLFVALLGVHFGLKINNTEGGIRWKENLKARHPGLYRAVYNKYYVDEFYEEYIIQPVLMLCQLARVIDIYIVDGIVNAVGWLVYQLARFKGWFDLAVVDGIVNGIAWIVDYFSNFLKPIQSGFVQNYMMVIVLFVLFYLLTLFIK
jgi:NADH-quinone oxidoreductase subunit L